jgi:hypothetical protein
MLGNKLFERTVAGGLSAAKTTPIAAIKAMKMKRILKLEGLSLAFGNVKWVLEDEINIISAGSWYLYFFPSFLSILRISSLL